MADSDPTDEPYAIPRIRSQAFSCGPPGLHGPVLLCPRCGGSTLEFLGVLTFDREADGRSISFVRVYDSITAQHRMPTSNPITSQHRWHGVTVEFSCNHCHSIYQDPQKAVQGLGIWLEIVEERFSSAMHWVFDPIHADYEVMKALADGTS